MPPASTSTTNQISTSQATIGFINAQSGLDVSPAHSTIVAEDPYDRIAQLEAEIKRLRVLLAKKDEQLAHKTQQGDSFYELAKLEYSALSYISQVLIPLLDPETHRQQRP